MSALSMSYLIWLSSELCECLQVIDILLLYVCDIVLSSGSSQLTMIGYMRSCLRAGDSKSSAISYTSLQWTSLERGGQS